MPSPARPWTRAAATGTAALQPCAREQSLHLHLDGSEQVLLRPRRLAALVHLEQGKERHRLGQPILVSEHLVEVETATARQQLAKHPEPALERNGGPDVAGVRLGLHPQQVAEGLTEPRRVVDLARGLE